MIQSSQVVIFETGKTPILLYHHGRRWPLRFLRAMNRCAGKLERSYMRVAHAGQSLVPSACSLRAYWVLGQQACGALQDTKGGLFACERWFPCQRLALQNCMMNCGSEFVAHNVNFPLLDLEFKPRGLWLKESLHPPLQSDLVTSVQRFTGVI